ncbi:MAG: protein-tyrosine phosphatase family protein [Methanobacteriota archaeon]
MARANERHRAILNYLGASGVRVMQYYTLDGGRLAGLPGPAYMEWDFARLRKMGFAVVVSLECARLNTFEIEDAGFEHKKICIDDFTAPTFDQIDEFLSFVDAKVAEGKRTLVHCHAGRGRTGTMLAAYLIHRGMSAEAAVREVRERAARAYGPVRGVIEPEQEETLYRFERRVRGG